MLALAGNASEDFKAKLLPLSLTTSFVEMEDWTLIKATLATGGDMLQIHKSLIGCLGVLITSGLSILNSSLVLDTVDCISMENRVLPFCKLV